MGANFHAVVPPMALCHAISRIFEGYNLSIDIKENFETAPDQDVEGLILKLIWNSFNAIREYLLDNFQRCEREIDYYGPSINLGKTIATNSLARGRVVARPSVRVLDTELHRAIAYVFLEMDKWTLPELKKSLRVPSASFFQTIEDTLSYTPEMVEMWELTDDEALTILHHHLYSDNHVFYRPLLTLCIIYLASFVQDEGSFYGFDVDRAIASIFEYYLKSTVVKVLNEESIPGFDRGNWEFRANRHLFQREGVENTPAEPDIELDMGYRYGCVINSKLTCKLDNQQYKSDKYDLINHMTAKFRNDGGYDSMIGIDFYFDFKGVSQRGTVVKEYSESIVKDNSMRHFSYKYNLIRGKGTAESYTTGMDNAVADMCRIFFSKDGGKIYQKPIDFI